MARPTKTDSPSEPLVSAYALLPVAGGGWTVREYLVPRDSTAHEDSAADTLGAAIGRVTRNHAKGAQ